jgi:GTP:adenosylcobinamide-phosphate guanylyltransferase
MTNPWADGTGAAGATGSVRFTAVVLAADRTANDPVARAAGVPCKALAPVGGTPMVLRVLNALGASREVGARIVCGPPPAALAHAHELRRLIDSGDVAWVENRSSPSASALEAMATVPATMPVLVTTADHALLTPAMVDHFCAAARARGSDVAVGLAPYEVVARAHPGMRRTAVRLRGGSYCGCNLFAFLTSRGRTAAAFWRTVEQERKRPWRLMRALGWGMVARYALRRLSLGDGLGRLSRRLGLGVDAVVLPFPRAAVDVDSIDDWRWACELSEAGDTGA